MTSEQSNFKKWAGSIAVCICPRHHTASDRAQARNKASKKVPSESKTKLAREAQKKAAAEAAVIIANYNATATETPAPAHTQNEPAPAPAQNSSVSNTQWLALGSLVVSLIGLYYKHEEFKSALSKIHPAKTAYATPVRPTPISNRIWDSFTPWPLSNYIRCTCCHDGSLHQRCDVYGLSIFI